VGDLTGEDSDDTNVKLLLFIRQLFLQLKDIFSDEDKAEDKNDLLSLQRSWIDLGHYVRWNEHIVEFGQMIKDYTCETIPATVGLVPNAGYYACVFLKIITIQLAFAILLGLDIAFRTTDKEFTLATQSPEQEMYAYYYSRAVYHNTKQHNEWNINALNTIRRNMKDQVKQARHCNLFQQINISFFSFIQAYANEITTTAAPQGNRKSCRRRYIIALHVQQFHPMCIIISLHFLLYEIIKTLQMPRMQLVKQLLTFRM
jgi:hypothetical protein